MKNEIVVEKGSTGISDKEMQAAIIDSLSDCREGLHKVLLIVPDFTRFHSNAGKIANFYYHELEKSCEVDLLEALGTHVPMTEEQIKIMYGDIPQNRFLTHNWRTDVIKLGQVPAEYVAEVSNGLIKTPIDVEVNKHLFENYDSILSIGQVVPHEVVGMANQSKNIFVGCGGNSMINSSHMLGAFYGLERIMGKDFSPVRKVFDYAQDHYLNEIPLTYVMTVTTAPHGKIQMHGLYIGRERKYFEMAVKKSQEKNLNIVDIPFNKVVVYLNADEFKSTWLGNKSIYRTRMAIADNGNLIVLAPGVEKFGEDQGIDRLIRKYGYCGRENVIKYCSENEDLRQNLSAAAHLIHGSSDGRFSITYCTRYLTKEEVEGVCFNYMPYDEAIKTYDPDKLTDGYNTLSNGERIYYISNPALGLWADKKKF